MNFKTVMTWIFAAIIISGCAGRTPNPIMIHQYNDDKKSCEALKHEMTFIEDEIQRLMPHTDKTKKNVALGVTGALFIVPLLFMDLSQAEQIEVNAYRQRYNHLAIIATDKKCETDSQQTTERKETSSSD